MEGEPLYVRGLTAASGFLKKNIGQSSADAGAQNQISITIQVNVPLTANSPQSVITISGLLGSHATHGQIDLTVVTLATSGEFSGTWHDTDKTLIINVNEDTQPGKDYRISFSLTNDKRAQTSPTIMIQTSGIVIQATEMISDVGKLDTLDDDGIPIKTPTGAKSPMFILAPKLIKRYAHQAGGSAWPAQENLLTLSFMPTVDIDPIAGATVSLMITGLKGIDKASGVVTLAGASANKFSDCRRYDANECTSARAVWDQLGRKLTMNVIAAIAASVEVTVTFAFNNTKKGQDSPELSIELVTDVDSLARKGLTLIEYNRTAPALSLANTVALADTRFTEFSKVSTKKVIGLLPKINLTNDRDYLSKNTQLGAVYEGYLLIDQAGDYLFANVGNDYVDIAVDGKVVSWRSSPGNTKLLMNTAESTGVTQQPTRLFLTKGKHTFRARMIQGTGDLELSAYWQTPASPDLFELIPNDRFEVRVEPLQLAPQIFGVEASKKNTDDVPLLIYRSAIFTTKKIGQSLTRGPTPGATNTITVTIRPQFELTGAKKSSITISGLVGSMTPDATLALLDADALFNSTARWNAKKASLILSVAPGQAVPADADTIFKFDLSNPTLPQSGASLVQISADGDVPISASAMVLATGNAVPLKVLAATFVEAAIGQTSSSPNTENTITVTIQPSVILSRGRRSTITIHGITGSITESTNAMPIIVASGNVPPFTAPFADLKLSFGPGCELANNKVLILDSSRTNFKGSELYLTEGSCKGNKTVVTSYNVSTRCATLESSLCNTIGAVRSVHVNRGGSGYKSGTISSAPGAAGSGLDGNCTVDEMGRIESVVLFNGGSGYANGTEIFCPSACDSTTCGVQSKSGGGGMAIATVSQDLAAAASASWDQLTGKLEMRVRGELKTTDPIVMSFKVQNGMTPQSSRDVYVMAGGGSPVGSTKLNGTAMAISGLDTTVTGLCTCAPSAGSSSCTCSTIMTDIPTGRDVYVLKAEYQCNGGATLVVKVATNQTAVTQPPSTCKDSCQTYHELFSWNNVAQQVNALGTGSLPLEVEASGVAADYCGAGHNLKVVFTLIY